MTLTFLGNKKLICCNAQFDGDLAVLSSRYRASELVCKAIGNVQMRLRTLTELVMAKNVTPNSFQPVFMDNYNDFINAFSSDMSGVLSTTETNLTTIAGLINGLAESAKLFTTSNVVSVD
jgi:hypothetical protein